MAEELDKIIEERYGKDGSVGLWFWFAAIVLLCGIVIAYMSPSKEVMDLLAPILFSSLGAAMILIAVDGIRRGELHVKHARIRRENRPVMFWLAALLYASLGVFMLVMGLMFKPAAVQETVPVEYRAYHEKALTINAAAHTVSLEKFLELREKPGTVVLDLRDREAYDRGHIRGAVHLGADVAEEKLATLVPDKNAIVLVYCSNSLLPIRMISLTGVSLPQFIALGYEDIYMLDAIWRESMTDGQEQLKQKGLWEEGRSE